MQCRTRGCYADIMSELLVSVKAEFTNFIRMNKATVTIPLVLGNTRHETALGDSIAGETSGNLTQAKLYSNGRVSKHSFISSAFRLPKMHRAPRDKHVIKETHLIGQAYLRNHTASYSISVLIHTGDLSPISRRFLI